MSKLKHPVEKLIQTIIYKEVEFEVVERPDVLWVGCLDYADNNIDESNISATLNRFQGLIELASIKEKINPIQTNKMNGMIYLHNRVVYGFVYV